jgi:hypothetical protein
MQNAITFDSSVLSRDKVYQRAYKESLAIYAKESTRKGRTLDQILTESMRGHYAEVWLMENGYMDDDRPYKDLFEPDGTPIEIKVTKCESYVRYVLDRCKDKFKMGINIAPKIYIFLNEPESTLYEFHGIFYWNGMKFIGSRPFIQPAISNLQTAITSV